MNKKLKKQIKAYVGIAGTILCTEKLNAQVVNVDIIPDDTLGVGANYLMDIDQDGNNDFIIQQVHLDYQISSWTGIHESFLFINGSGQNKVLGISQSPAFHGCAPYYYFQLYQAHPFMMGDTISDQILFPYQKQNGLVENWGHYVNNFSGTTSYCFNAIDTLNTERCIGIVLSDGVQKRFGWLKVELLYKKIVIKEYAYQSAPNVPIFACDTTNLATRISEYNHQQFIFSQQNNSIHISSLQKLNNANISVYDLLGKEILHQPFEGKKTTIKIDKKGIYFVEVKPVPNSSGSEKGIFRKKIFIY